MKKILLVLLVLSLCSISMAGITGTWVKAVGGSGGNTVRTFDGDPDAFFNSSGQIWGSPEPYDVEKWYFTASDGGLDESGAGGWYQTFYFGGSDQSTENPNIGLTTTLAGLVPNGNYRLYIVYDVIPDVNDVTGVRAALPGEPFVSYSSDALVAEGYADVNGVDTGIWCALLEYAYEAEMGLVYADVNGNIAVAIEPISLGTGARTNYMGLAYEYFGFLGTWVKAEGGIGGNTVRSSDQTASGWYVEAAGDGTAGGDRDSNKWYYYSSDGGFDANGAGGSSSTDYRMFGFEGTDQTGLDLDLTTTITGLEADAEYKISVVYSVDEAQSGIAAGLSYILDYSDAFGGEVEIDLGNGLGFAREVPVGTVKADANGKVAVNVNPLSFASGVSSYYHGLTYTKVAEPTQNRGLVGTYVDAVPADMSGGNTVRASNDDAGGWYVMADPIDDWSDCPDGLVSFPPAEIDAWFIYNNEVGGLASDGAGGYTVGSSGDPNYWPLYYDYGQQASRLWVASPIKTSFTIPENGNYRISAVYTLNNPILARGLYAAVGNDPLQKFVASDISSVATGVYSRVSQAIGLGDIFNYDSFEVIGFNDTAVEITITIPGYQAYESPIGIYSFTSGQVVDVTIAPLDFDGSRTDYEGIVFEKVTAENMTCADAKLMGPLAGDYNADCSVDLQDFAVMAGVDASGGLKGTFVKAIPLGYDSVNGNTTDAEDNASGWYFGESYDGGDAWGPWWNSGRSTWMVYRGDYSLDKDGNTGSGTGDFYDIHYYAYQVSSEPSEMKTTISGLTGGKDYEVYVVYNVLEHMSEADTGIKAAITGGSLVEYNKTNGQSTGFTNNFTIYSASLGIVEADVDGKISVNIGRISQENGGRSHYIGLSYDANVPLVKFAILAENWLECIDPVIDWCTIPSLD
jgi:hypothetical protein